jgi:hypothetical protein
MGLRLLIAAGEAALGPEDIPPSVRSLIETADDILAVAPTLPGRWEWLSSATDKRKEQADERLQAVLGHLEEMGVEAKGTVGADDPLLAFEDAIRQFSPDHILIALRSEQHAGWQERDLLDKVLERFALPITVFQL